MITGKQTFELPPTSIWRLIMLTHSLQEWAGRKIFNLFLVVPPIQEHSIYFNLLIWHINKYKCVIFLYASHKAFTAMLMASAHWLKVCPRLLLYIIVYSLFANIYSRQMFSYSTKCIDECLGLNMWAESDVCLMLPCVLQTVVWCEVILKKIVFGIWIKSLSFL